jgi:hypothetical protein
MRIPSVDPVGLTRTPRGYLEAPRHYPPVQRGLAALLLAVFSAVVVATTALSLGGYCLTSDGENTRGLPHRPPVTAGR